MNHRKTLLAASIVAGLCLSVGAYAQDSTQNQNENGTQSSTANKKNAKELSTVIVTGIRNSQALSCIHRRELDERNLRFGLCRL